MKYIDTIKDTKSSLIANIYKLDKCNIYWISFYPNHTDRSVIMVKVKSTDKIYVYKDLVQDIKIEWIPEAKIKQDGRKAFIGIILVCFLLMHRKNGISRVSTKSIYI